MSNNHLISEKLDFQNFQKSYALQSEFIQCVKHNSLFLALCRELG